MKCAIVEKNATPERVDFLKKLLELNKYTGVVVKSPPPKVVAPVVDPAISGIDPNAPPTYTIPPGLAVTTLTSPDPDCPANKEKS